MPAVIKGSWGCRDDLHIMFCYTKSDICNVNLSSKNVTLLNVGQRYKVKPKLILLGFYLCVWFLPIPFCRVSRCSCSSTLFVLRNKMRVSMKFSFLIQRNVRSQQALWVNVHELYLHVHFKALKRTQCNREEESEQKRRPESVTTVSPTGGEENACTQGSEKQNISNLCFLTWKNMAFPPRKLPWYEQTFSQNKIPNPGKGEKRKRDEEWGRRGKKPFNNVEQKVTD